MSQNKNLAFEAAVSRLEEIVSLLEKGNTSLDESLKLYEEGVSLVRYCNSKLDNAEQQIKMLVSDDKGELIEKDFTNNV